VQIVLAENAGFCWGVRRAVDIAIKAAKNGRVFCLGELIHNSREINRLSGMGIRFIDSVDSLKKGDNVIIRSHGISPKVVDILKRKNVNVIDATCPFVKDVHEKVVELKSSGYPVLILGNPRHPEVIGIAGHVENPMVIDSFEDLESLEPHRRLGVVCQTTLNVDFFREAVSILALKVKELKVFNTICNTTLIRQKETRDLAS
jgi:4-hydroxy-3-methylbut-2-enyl diphosphate reductase